MAAANGNPGLVDTPRPAYHPDLIEVQIRSDAVAGLPVDDSASAMVQMGRLPAALGDPLRALRRNRNLRAVVPVFTPHHTGFNTGTEAMGGAHVASAFVRSVRDTESSDLAGTVMLQLSTRADVDAVRKDLASSRAVRQAHLVPLRWLLAAPELPDPLQNRQWGLRAIEWFTQPVPDASTVGVAVLDTGIDEAHPDLSAANYFHDGTSAVDVIGHGTHVAGILSAKANNRVGVTGIARCALSAYKIFGDQPASDGQYYVDPLTYRRALNAVRTSGDRIVNLSIGGTAKDPTEELLFSRLAQTGVIAVAAMGNEYEKENPVEYPGAFTNVIAVGATTETNQRAPFSNTGARITIAAPGVNILSTLPMKTSVARRSRTQTAYASWSGTSMATPHVSGALALLLSTNPGLSADEVVARLKQSATKLPQMKGTTSHEFGAGLLNIRHLLM